jgi:hypothetical protein
MQKITYLLGFLLILFHLLNLDYDNLSNWQVNKGSFVGLIIASLLLASVLAGRKKQSR